MEYLTFSRLDLTFTKSSNPNPKLAGRQKSFHNHAISFRYQFRFSCQFHGQKIFAKLFIDEKRNIFRLWEKYIEILSFSVSFNWHAFHNIKFDNYHMFHFRVIKVHAFIKARSKKSRKKFACCLLISVLNAFLCSRELKVLSSVWYHSRKNRENNWFISGWHRTVIVKSMS